MIYKKKSSNKSSKIWRTNNMKILDLKLQAFGPFVKEQHIPFSVLNDKGLFLIKMFLSKQLAILAF